MTPPKPPRRRPPEAPEPAANASSAAVAAPGAVLPAGSAQLLDRLKADTRTTRVRVAAAANREQVALYWRAGCPVVERQAGEPWGSAVLDGSPLTCGTLYAPCR